ncbi:MAG: asparagine synthase (glutamine-hydrolyzing) [Parcubacteria group bacterium]|nr:asparagine synthase (glutamine-hydrolyzing) [Parcubacteria group bacterium]
MCAIIGALGVTLPREQVEHARDSMTHRGPDDAGLYYDAKEGVALGHRRLSIIDLTQAGHQPFVSNDGRFIIVYNGEVYNYVELKEELKGMYEFKTETDTEVLLAAYMAWGEKCLNRLNGMFAFAIWDKKEKKLFCARDRMGVKPFFYTVQRNAFYFSSEIKGLHALGFGKAPNERMIFDYLYYGLYDHTNETFFSDIQKLPAGSYLLWENGAITISSYWDLKNHGSLKGGDTQDAESLKGRFKELLADAIRIRFRSDVPVGINLSSGLDSNTLLYFSKKILNQDLPSFSFCYEDERYNECRSIEAHLNQAQRARWHTTSISPETILTEAARMNLVQGEPYGGIPTLAHDHLFRMAREKGVTVLLEGQGGDEILGGYSYYRHEYEKDRGGEPTQKRVAPSLYGQDASSLRRANILNDDFVKKHEKNAIFFEAPLDSHVQNAQYRDIAHTKLPRVLRFHDHMSMAYGTELRLPLLDYRLVEFCFSLPIQYKINELSQKVLIREAMGEYLPDIVGATEKKTFSSVQGDWFRKYHKEMILEILNSPSFKRRPYWNHEVLGRQVEDFWKGNQDNSFFIWQCVNLELWFRAFID